MIVDMRTYTLHPGRLGAYFKLYESEGWAIQRKHLGEPVGYYYVDIGVQNRIVHLWGYTDIAERARRRASMENDPAWNSYRAKSGLNFQAQENRILKPAPFWPMQPTAGGPIGLVDMRVYTFQVGKLAEYFRFYETDAMAIQLKHLGRCIGFYQSDIGPQNQIVHLWAYESIQDREQRRARLATDPGWGGYLAKATQLLLDMQNATLKPAPFWTPKM
ncbi:MAG TPA: NIPSNAP family protein [Alphaproteobacteria bacterium]|nr:NIPSNAP family protein [Alphaproteobacteria bacterium]